LHPKHLAPEHSLTGPATLSRECTAKTRSMPDRGGIQVPFGAGRYDALARRNVRSAIPFGRVPVTSGIDSHPHAGNAHAPVILSGPCKRTMILSLSCGRLLMLFLTVLRVPLYAFPTSAQPFSSRRDRRRKDACREDPGVKNSLRPELPGDAGKRFYAAKLLQPARLRNARFAGHWGSLTSLLRVLPMGTPDG
jgi:hypothetical protein